MSSPQSKNGPNPILSRIGELVGALRRQICRSAGHRRSRPTVFKRGEQWYAFCARCGVKLLRVRPQTWRALTDEEVANEPHFTLGGNSAAAMAFPDQAQANFTAGNKPKRGRGNGSGVAAGHGYDVNYFARKHEISRDQARDLIKRVGNDREKLNEAAQRLKKG
jgi:hypothetical protein